MSELQTAERELFELTEWAAMLRRASNPMPYVFKHPAGPVSLLELFGQKDTLFVIRNMGIIWVKHVATAFCGHTDSVVLCDILKANLL